MKTKVNGEIIYTHLTTNKWQTVVAILGVTFGVSMYIFMNSFMVGVNKAQDDLSFSALAHIRIYNENNLQTFDPVTAHFDTTNTLINIRNRKSIKYTDGINNSTAIIHLLEKQKEITAFASQLNFSVYFCNGSNEISGRVSGIEVLNEDKLFGIGLKVTSGDWKSLNHQKSGIILGKVLAKNIGVKLGDNINVVASNGASKNFIVTGIIETSLKDIDKSKAWMNIAAARQLLGKNSDYVSDIQINIKSREKTAVLVKKLSDAIPYNVEAWQTANEQLVAATKLRNIIAIAVSLTILIVAGFGIYNIMNMTINQKIREIAILKAMGFGGKDIVIIFLSQAVIIGILGAIVGVIFGFLISELVGLLPFRIAGLSTLPIYFQWIDFALAVFFGISTTLFAGYLPARKASKIDPVIIIRG